MKELTSSGSAEITTTHQYQGFPSLIQLVSYICACVFVRWGRVEDCEQSSIDSTPAGLWPSLANEGLSVPDTAECQS